MIPVVHKVTCFITRQAGMHTELLLFNHPYVGVQIPAGTADPGEDPEIAARREAAEESGLEGLVLLQKLHVLQDPPPEGMLLTSQPTPVYSRPDPHSMDWAHFRHGLPVERLRQSAGFIQVRFAEDDQFIDPHYTTYNITGWVPETALTDQRIRHFYLFRAVKPAPERWELSVDYTVFQLFWSRLDDLPPIVSPQDRWLRWLPSQSP
jgi:8-oxo-dGTP pyrophosphatase MutT (NUDIX family)